MVKRKKTTKKTQKRLINDILLDVKRLFDKELIKYPKYKIYQFFYMVGWSIENYQARLRNTN